MIAESNNKLAEGFIDACKAISSMNPSSIEDTPQLKRNLEELVDNKFSSLTQEIDSKMDKKLDGFVNKLESLFKNNK